MADQICNKCGQETAPCFFTHSALTCDQCWHIHDLGRFEEARPAKGSKPIAPVMKLSTPGKIGIKCPHCSYNVERYTIYFCNAKQLERCPRCMGHYIVKKGDAK